MLAGAPIAYWIGFHVVVIALIVCDLVLLNRGATHHHNQARAPIGKNLGFVLFLLALAAAFGIWLGRVRGAQTGLEFASSYLIELSLSVDNLFIFLVMFRAFGLGLEEQRKALLYGIMGAILMRGLFIFGGIALLTRFAWIQYIFGALILGAAARLALNKKSVAESGSWMSWLTLRGNNNPGRILLYSIIAIEVVDLVFALDSIPAVLAITHDPFVAYTSNIAAILGLRSLYFLLAALLDRLRFLHLGLAAILAFVGCKMLLARWWKVPIELSLAFILLTIAIAATASLLRPKPQGEIQHH